LSFERLPALNLKAIKMAKPGGIEVVRRAYELWEQAGKPDGRDQEFYLQAERELQEALDKETPGNHPERTSDQN
jgi:Protein of unknown function (DUF2934)